MTATVPVGTTTLSKVLPRGRRAYACMCFAPASFRLYLSGYFVPRITLHFLNRTISRQPPLRWYTPVISATLRRQCLVTPYCPQHPYFLFRLQYNTLSHWDLTLISSKVVEGTMERGK